MYILETKIYNPKSIITTEFDKFSDGFIAAKHIAEVLKGTIGLTRHSTCEGSINHAGLYCDIYNEVSILVADKDTYFKFK